MNRIRKTRYRKRLEIKLVESKIQETQLGWLGQLKGYLRRKYSNSNPRRTTREIQPGGGRKKNYMGGDWRVDTR